MKGQGLLPLLTSLFVTGVLFLVATLVLAKPGEQVGTPEYAVICDNLDTSCFTKYESSGDWGYVDPSTGHNEYTYDLHAYWTFNSYNTPIDWGKWAPNLAQEGKYDIYIWYPHFPGYYPETNSAHYQVHHSGGNSYFIWNQAINYGGWKKLTTVCCPAGETCYVKLTDETHESPSNTRRVWFDAVKFTRIGSCVTPSPTPEPTVTTTPTPIPPAGDIYEPDDTCVQAQAIPTDGTIQHHTLHQYADFDWVRFSGTAGATYVVRAASTSGRADMELELYDTCGGPLQAFDDGAFGRDAQIVYPVPANGTYYVKAFNTDPADYGPDVTYDLSVRRQDTNPAAILVAGHNNAWQLQSNIDYCTNTAYRAFRHVGVPEDRIYYLNPNPGLQDPDGDGLYDDVDAVATAANLRDALETWAVSQLHPDEQLFLYLMDHGAVDAFCTDGETDLVTPLQLDGWLQTVEDATGCDVNVIVEACHAGSFIDQVPTWAEEISAPGRVVIASTSRTLRAFPSPQGAYFSDAFWTAAQNSANLWEAFLQGVAAVKAMGLWQEPWLDDNGNATPLDGADGVLAASRGLAASFAGHPPVVDAVTVTLGLADQGMIQAAVRDDGGVQSVWAIVVPPSFVEPPPGDPFTWPELGLPVVELLPAGGQYERAYTFAEAGLYRVVVYARDGDDNQALPVVGWALTGNAVFLPVVRK